MKNKPYSTRTILLFLLFALVAAFCLVTLFGIDPASASGLHSEPYPGPSATQPPAPTRTKRPTNTPYKTSTPPPTHAGPTPTYGEPSMIGLESFSASSKPSKGILLFAGIVTACLAIAILKYFERLYANK